MKKLLLVKQHAYNKWEYDDEFVNKVRNLGYEIYMHPTQNDPFSEEELQCEVFANVSAFQKVGVDNFPNLRFVHGLSAGYEHFPLEEFKQRGIRLCNLKGVYGIPISECIISGILSICKKEYVFFEQKKHKIFRRFSNLAEIYGKTAAILGTGDIAYQTAIRLKAFGVRTIGFNRHPSVLEYFDEVHSINEIHQYLPISDFVIITLPSNEESYHFANKEFFHNMKKTAIFVNVGRGSVVDETALIDALEQQQIKAAVLDVYEVEPLPEKSPLWEMDNVYLYPHTMSGSDLAFERIEDLLYENLKAYLEGKPLINEIIL